MKIRHARVALAAALLLAGCAVQPTTNAPTSANNDPLGLGDAVAARYQALSANATPLAIATVAASSTSTQVAGVTASASSVWSDKWFSASNVTDGNLHSAWEPAAPIMDTAPYLTLNLAQATKVTGLGIKMDAGARCAPVSRARLHQLAGHDGQPGQADLPRPAQRQAARLRGQAVLRR